MYVAAMIRGQTIARNYANPVAVARCLEKKKEREKREETKAGASEKERERRESENDKKEREKERDRVEEVLLAQHRELALTDG